MATAPASLDLSTASDSGTSNSDDLTNNTMPVITGTGVDGEVITLTSDQDGLLQGSATVTGGVWTFYVTTPLSENTHAITATATDGSNGTANSAAPLTFEIDTTADAAPAGTGITAGTDTGTSDSDDITDDTTPDFEGTTVAGSTVEIFVDGVSAGQAVVVGTDWTFTPGTPLAEGPRVITARATDPAGNVSDASVDYTVTIDDTDPDAPVITEIQLSDGTANAVTTAGLTNDTTPTISGTGEVGATITVTIDTNPSATDFTETAVVDADGNWTVTVTGGNAMTEGDFTVVATATDVAGNTSGNSNSVALELDTTPPGQAVITEVSQGTDDLSAVAPDPVTSVTLPTISGTSVGADGEIITVTDQNNNVIGTASVTTGAWSFTYAGTPLTDGTYNLTATASDAAGNTTAPAGTFDLEIDTTADAAPAIVSVNGETTAEDRINSEDEPVIVGTGVAGSEITIYEGSVAPGNEVNGSSIVVDVNGDWTFTASEAPNGAYTLIAVATDPAGNKSAESTPFTFTVDDEAPNAPVVSDISADTGSSDSDNVTSDAAQTISGTAEAGSSVLVTIDGTPAAAPVVADAMGNWTYTHTFASNTIATGATHVITATATDAAGNTSAASSAYALVLDTTAPTASPIALDAGSVSPNGVVTVTDEAAPTFSFTAENNSTLEIDYGDGNGFVAAGTGTGALQTVTKPAAYATEGSKTVTLRATDLAGNQTTVAALAITVNLIATDLELSNNLIIDSATDGTVVGSVEVTDGTPSDTHTYVLTNNDGGNFVLNGTTLEVDGTPTFAANVDRTIEIQVTDGAGNVYTETMTVEVEAQPTVGNNGGNAAGEAVTGTFTADNIDAGAGEDTISTGFGEDTVTTGDGADVIQDSATNLNGDTVTDFDDEDEFVFTGAQFDFNDLTFTAGAGGAPSTLAIDSDGDGTADTTITLNEALTGGNFLVFQQGSETKVSYEQSLLALGEGTSIATDAENGIVSQSFLTGDGTNTYNVSLDSARSGAGAKNLLGVYEVDAAGEIVDVRLVFADTSVSTDPSFTITGVDAGNKLGFFLVFDGADLVTNAATDVFDFVPANGAAGEAFVSAGTALDLTINGTVVSNNIFHSLDTTLNGDGVQHAVSGVQADGNGIDIGFEDLFGGGDRDYQDVVISVDIV